jgi:hypothetical protein
LKLQLHLEEIMELNPPYVELIPFWKTESRESHFVKYLEDLHILEMPTGGVQQPLP